MKGCGQEEGTMKEGEAVRAEKRDREGGDAVTLLEVGRKRMAGGRGQEEWQGVAGVTGAPGVVEVARV